MKTILHPGDVALSERGGVLETLLGSCVALLLTDPRQTVGVMCHVVNGALNPPTDRTPPRSFDQNPSHRWAGAQRVEQQASSRTPEAVWKMALDAGLECNHHARLDARLDARFGEPAFVSMAKRLSERGLDIHQCQAWLAGGGAPHVGESNVVWAKQRLARAGIKLLGSDTGGLAARRVHWRVGDVPEITVLPIEAAA